MQTIVIVDDCQATVALSAAHAEQVHRLIIHTEQQTDTGSLIRFQECSTFWKHGCKTSIKHIEITT